MTVINEKFTIHTAGNNDIIDITKQVQNCVYQHALKDALVCVSIQGSTSAVTTIEYEEGLVKDLKEDLMEAYHMSYEEATDYLRTGGLKAEGDGMVGGVFGRGG